MPLDSHPQPIPTATRKGGSSVWLRRLGVAGFIFFLVKGLLWLMVPVLIYFFGVGVG